VEVSPEKVYQNKL